VTGAGLGGEELLTRRLSLRRPVTADIDAILAVHSDPRACAHNPSDMLVTRAQAEELYERWDSHWHRFGYGYWVVRRRGRDEQLGFCGIKTVRFGDGTALNLLCRLFPSAWGDGIGTEAAAAVVGWAARRLPGQAVIARVRPQNAASRRLAVKAGLSRAEHLDRPGEDGDDCIYVSPGPGAIMPL
jgi:RimJ/RimL family protein N-acetyltransferase